jgi:CRISPR system Cascade subunit CasB
MEQQQALPDIIGRITGAMERNLIGPGERAELRRLDVEHPYSPAFWKIMTAWVGSSHTPTSETRWAIALSGFARMGPPLNKRGARLGQALASADYSETRLLKLLRVKGPTFADTVRRLCSFLAAKAEPVDWVELASFILTVDEQKADEARRRIARDYYATS